MKEAWKENKRAVGTLAFRRVTSARSLYLRKQDAINGHQIRTVYQPVQSFTTWTGDVLTNTKRD